MADYEVEARIPGGLELFITNVVPLDKNLEIIKKAKGELAVPQQVAQARKVAPKGHSVWQYGSRVAASVVYVPEKNYVLWTLGLKHSPIFKDPAAAVKAHKADSEVYHTKSELNALLAEVKAGKNVLLDRRVKDFEIPSSELHKDALGRFYFRNDAEAYDNKLTEIGIENLPVWLVDRDYVQKQKKPFGRALWLRNVGDRSGLSGGSRYLNYYWARGVRRVAPQGAAQISAYETIARENGINSPGELQDVLKKYSKVKELFQ